MKTIVVIILALFSFLHSEANELYFNENHYHHKFDTVTEIDHTSTSLKVTKVAREELADRKITILDETVIHIEHTPLSEELSMYRIQDDLYNLPISDSIHLIQEDVSEPAFRGLSSYVEKQEYFAQRKVFSLITFITPPAEIVVHKRIAFLPTLFLVLIIVLIIFELFYFSRALKIRKITGKHLGWDEDIFIEDFDSVLAVISLFFLFITFIGSLNPLFVYLVTIKTSITILVRIFLFTKPSFEKEEKEMLDLISYIKDLVAVTGEEEKYQRYYLNIDTENLLFSDLVKGKKIVFSLYYYEDSSMQSIFYNNLLEIRFASDKKERIEVRFFIDEKDNFKTKTYAKGGIFYFRSLITTFIKSISFRKQYFETSWKKALNNLDLT